MKNLCQKIYVHVLVRKRERKREIIPVNAEGEVVSCIKHTCIYVIIDVMRNVDPTSRIISLA